MAGQSEAELFEQGFSAPQICIDIEDRNQAFRTLIHTIAECLGQAEVNTIVYHHCLPEKEQQETGMHVLMQLERKGVFSPHKIQPLTDLMKEVNRHDLVTRYIEDYLQRYGESKTPERHSSMPSQNSPRLVHPKARHLSNPASMKTSVSGNRLHVPETVERKPVRIPSIPEFQSLADNPKLVSDQGVVPAEHRQAPPPNTQDAPKMHSSYSQGEFPPANKTNLKHQPHSYPDVQGSEQEHSYCNRMFSDEEGELAYSNRTRHMSDHLGTRYRRTSTPIPPAGPGSVSGSSGLHVDLHSHPSSLHCSSEILHSTGVGSMSSQSEHSSHFSFHEHQQPSYREEHSPHVDSSHRYVPAHIPALHYDVTQSNLHGPTGTLVSLVLPIALPHATVDPGGAGMCQHPQCTLTPSLPLRYNADHSDSRELYKTRSEVGVGRVSDRHRFPVDGNMHRSMSLNHSDSGLLMPPCPGYNKSPAHSSMGDSIQPWMSASNDVSLHSIHQDHSTGGVTDHDPVETSQPQTPTRTPKDVEESAKCESPLASLKKMPEPQDSPSPPTKSRLWLRKLGRRKNLQDSTLRWPVKRNVLNKAIWDHKENKFIPCSEKLNLEFDAGSKYNPRLVFSLHPYGLDEDRNANVTLQVVIEVPKKCRRLPESAEVKLSVVACEPSSREPRELGDKHVVTKKANLREFFVYKFVTHQSLKNSRSDYIEVRASAELINTASD